MPLFQRKQGRVDATRHWVGDTRFPLELDLTRHSLSGMGIGAPIDGLMRLGPAEDPQAAEDEIFRYYSRGLEVFGEEGFITGYRILWRPVDGFRIYPGRCFFREAEIKLGPETTEVMLAALFGEAYWRDEDDDEILLFYEFGRIEWQIELTKKGALSQWSIVTPPMLADAEQRAAYHVTKPWPPETPARIRPRAAESIFKKP